MTSLLFVSGRGGPALSYAIPKLTARSAVSVLPLSALSATDTSLLEGHGCEILGLPRPGDAVPAIIRAARAARADGVLTFSEYAVVAVASACLVLGLPGAGHAVGNARNKIRMRQCWHDAGVPEPAFVPVRSLADLYAARCRLPSPFLLKSAWGAGSVGQRVVHGADDLLEVWTEVRRTLGMAAAEGRCDYALPSCIDELLAEEIINSTTSSWYDAQSSVAAQRSGWGDYLSVEGFVVAGTYHPVCITGRLPTIAPFTEVANLAPCALPAEAQRTVERHARAAVDALGLDTCATHTEVKLGPDRTVSLLETAARPPGAMVAREVEEAWGVDLLDLAARFAVGSGSQGVELPEVMLTSGARRAAATVALLAADSSGRPWQTRPVFDADAVDWGRLVAPGTTVEVVPDTTLPAGSRMPAYDPAGGTMNFAGLAFVTASDVDTVLVDARAILDGLEAALPTGPARGDRGGRSAVDYAAERPGLEETVRLFRRARLNGPLNDHERVSRMLAQATSHGTARINGRLVGYVRVLTDFAYNGFVADLAVDPDSQRQGIGAALLKRATDPYPEVKFVVMPDAQSAGFYARCGFEPAPTCVVRPRRS